MKKKGSVVIYSLMVGLCVIILAMALAPAIVEQVNSTRNQTTNTSFTDADGNVGNITNVGLDCSNSAISNFDKAVCLASDLTPFYFIGFLILLGGAIVGAIITFGG